MELVRGNVDTFKMSSLLGAGFEGLVDPDQPGYCNQCLMKLGRCIVDTALKYRLLTCLLVE